MGLSSPSKQDSDVNIKTSESYDPYIMFGRVELLRLRASREQFATSKEDQNRSC